MLTNKCKTDFENWYGNEHPNGYWYALVNFYGLPFSMQYGVYVDFFDSVGIRINICFDKYFDVDINGNWEYAGKQTETRQEAREQAILKANEIYNN